MNKSLEEVNASVNTDRGSGFRRLLAFLGPAYMVSVGYMDPGNWATDIAGGSKFGYSLIWVLLMSNLIALLLQSHCARLGIVSGRDLAQASRENYPRAVNFFLYLLAEIAIAACDLAEVLGMAIGLHLLFPSVSIFTGVCITVLDSFLLLFLMNKGIRKLEAFIISLVALIGISFLIQLLIAKPELKEIAGGIIPHIENSEALYIAIGIIGATVMPHNLYLHSSLVQTRRITRDPKGLRKAIRFNTIDSAVALNLALFVNAAILILAATAFYKNGQNEITDIQDAHAMLAPMLGSTLAPILFAIALIAAGQSSTITGTLAGQVVMEGYLNLRLRPWVRRLLTRLIAIVPALLAIGIMGDSATGKLLIFSQVVLSLQLGFAIIPLIHFVSDKRIMGELCIPRWQKILSWVAAAVIIGLNLNMVYNELSAFISEGSHPLLVSFTLVPLCFICVLVLMYIIVQPYLFKVVKRMDKSFHTDFRPLELSDSNRMQRIGITVDFSASDQKAINKALQLGDATSEYILIHILESAGAVIYGEEFSDRERSEDLDKLLSYQQVLREAGYKAEIKLGFGDTRKAIPGIIEELQCDTLVVGTHGHRTLKDLLFGSTIENIRHHIKVPMVLV